MIARDSLTYAWVRGLAEAQMQLAHVKRVTTMGNCGLDRP